MAFTVEDGTGVPGATALASVAQLDDYLADMGATVTATLTEREVALIKASAYLSNESRYRWRGARVSPLQLLSWPRTGVALKDGPALPEGVVPPGVVRATCFLAYRALTSQPTLQPVLENGGLAVQTRTIDVLTTTFFAPAGGRTPMAEAVMTEAQGWIAPFLRDVAGGPADDVATPTLLHTDPDAFATGAFDWR